jgi:DNA-directed RNA polymerase subunit RPC12/RpoP
MSETCFRDITKLCINCGKELILINSRDVKRKRYCSRKCLITVTHNDESRKKAWNKTKGVKNDKKGHPGSSHPMYGKKMPEEIKMKLSNTISKLIVDGKLNNKIGYNRGFIETRFGRVYYRSSYELDFIRMCEIDSNIKSLKSEPFRIKMDNDRYYIPDFLVNQFEIVEIKPSRLLNYNMYKIEQGLKYSKMNGFKYKVVTEKELYYE